MEIVLEVPDKDAARVLDLLKGIKHVKVKSPKKPVKRPAAELLEDLKQALEDVKRYQRGEIELQSWDDLYAELQAEEAAEGASNEAIEPVRENRTRAGHEQPHE